MVKKLMVSGVALLFSVSLGYGQDHVLIPFVQHVAAPIEIDGELSDWNFCFPVDLNQSSVPQNSIAHAFFPTDNQDLSGSIKLMWDEDCLYFMAHVTDDHPGVWADHGRLRDGFELYLGNYALNSALTGAEHGAPFRDDNEGRYEVMLGCYFDAAEHQFEIVQFQPEERSLLSAETVMTGQVWGDGAGYTLEGKIAWADLASQAGNEFAFVGGEIVAATFGLIDMDAAQDAQFKAYYFSHENPWEHPGGRGWQALEFKPARENQFYSHAFPYMKRASAEVTVDADLSDWNFCFPVDMRDATVPEGGRSRGWAQTGDEDISGTLMFMYDESSLYFAGRITDDRPGQHAGGEVHDGWSFDQIELYLGNYDIGEALHGESHGSNYYDESDGRLERQFAMTYGDSGAFVYKYVPGKTAPPWISLFGENTMTEMAGQIWADGSGYTIEGRIDLLEAVSANFNYFILEPGMRVPATYSIYDRDMAAINDFGGVQYSEDAPWSAPGGSAWQYVDIVDVCLYDLLDEHTAVEHHAGQDIRSFNLHANYPNPFNPATHIGYDLNRAGSVSLKIYSVTGQVVQTVIAQEHRVAGHHSVDVDMHHLPSGVYLYVLEQNGRRSVRKMTLLK